jgi:DNA-binding NarL/FixJ family response regulator
MRCVIVDDNESFLAAARELLEREGIAVVGGASNAAEAFERVAGLQPDVVLVDIDLGPESGFDLVRRLADDPAGHASRLVLISTHAHSDFADLIAASPAAGFVPKSELSAAAIYAVIAEATPPPGK